MGQEAPREVVERVESDEGGGKGEVKRKLRVSGEGLVKRDPASHSQQPACARIIETITSLEIDMAPGEPPGRGGCSTAVRTWKVYHIGLLRCAMMARKGLTRGQTKACGFEFLRARGGDDGIGCKCCIQDKVQPSDWCIRGREIMSAIGLVGAAILRSLRTLLLVEILFHLISQRLVQ